VTNKLIVVLLALVIGLALTPVVGDFTDNLTQPLITNTTTAGYTGTNEVLQPSGMYNGTTVGSLIDILPILFVIILIAGTVGFIVISSRKS
jgi:large-conductance mechanosensitive channel